MDLNDASNKIDVSKFQVPDYTYKLSQQVNRDMEERNRMIQEAGEQAYQRSEQFRKAAVQTAENTAEMKGQLYKVVENQNEYIDILKEQVKLQADQIENQEAVLEMLKKFFASGEDGVAVQKEIMKIMLQDEKHPIREFLTDKGGDLGVAALTNIMPIAWSAIKTYLIIHGILV
ncbi:MAG: hypothetical protein PHS74_08030 [Lachnospiraceae bacterium]|nr:hypothetical protein [Lachnospiraceae bacterium]